MTKRKTYTVAQAVKDLLSIAACTRGIERFKQRTGSVVRRIADTLRQDFGAIGYTLSDIRWLRGAVDPEQGCGLVCKTCVKDKKKAGARRLFAALKAADRLVARSKKA
jgi:hypothetical protein